MERSKLQNPVQCPARSINELTLFLFPLFVNSKQCQLIRNFCHFFLWELYINLNINNQFHVCQYWKKFTSPQASLEIPTNEMENLNSDINRKKCIKEYIPSLLHINKPFIKGNYNHLGPTDYY